MAKVFKTNAGALKFIVKQTDEVAEDTLPKLTKLFVADANDQFVPEDSADLKNSAFNNSEFDKGLAIWQTPYARRRYYEGSITGVAFWTLRNSAQNKKKYKEFIIKNLKRGT